MKYYVCPNVPQVIESPPARGAWIEIHSLPTDTKPPPVSPPARGAWIEIRHSIYIAPFESVAPREGGVD